MNQIINAMRKRVCDANQSLPKHGLVKFTWGNVSEVNRELGVIVIKPSGVDYDELTPENMVVTDLDGKVLEGDLRPSSDLPTHVQLYKAWPEIASVVHTHSTEAVGWAQAGRDIPFYGTTHADYFYGSIPCARSLTKDEVEVAYEKDTGLVIIEEFERRSLNPVEVPGIVVRNHGPFTWGKNPENAVYHSVVLEEVSKMNQVINDMRKRVCDANQSLPKHGLVKFTWGNVSEVNRELGVIVIKPSGVDYDELTPENMVVTDLDGKVLEGDLRPSSDLPTHVQLYKAWPGIASVVHTHSTEAVGWAQAGRDIPFYGTTHADYFYGSIPCARSLTKDEVEVAYEKDTGLVIVEEFERRGLNPVEVPGIVVRNHGPFTWGKNPENAVYHSVVLEEVSKMNRFTEQINPRVEPAPQYILEKHYQRKHGPNAYYGQKK